MFYMKGCFMAKLSEYLKNIFLLLLVLQFVPIVVRTLKNYYVTALDLKTKVGYLVIKDTITTAAPYIKELKKLFENKDIKAILLKIDSGGGAAGSSQAIFHEINFYKKEHPKTVVVVVENICASGAYYIACAADYIVASPSAFIGSIGAYIPRPQLNEFLNQFKIKYEVVKAGEFKMAGDPLVAPTPEQIAMLQQLTEDTYRQFTHDVAQKRPKLSLKQTDTWANGKVFTGYQALQLGLIDELGAQSTAVQKIKEKESIEGDIEWVTAEKVSTFAKFLGTEDQEIDSDSLATHIAYSFGNFLIRQLSTVLNVSSTQGF